MPHCYASLDDFKAFLVSNGATDYGTTEDGAMLPFLEASSRAVDGHCHRSRFGSGFGPRTGTNRYDANGEDTLTLEDDLLSTTSVTVYAGTGGSSSTLTVDVDYYLQPYSGAPYRSIQMIKSYLPSGYRVVAIAGTWGAWSEPIAIATTVSSGLAVGTTANTFTTSAGPVFSPGDTLLCESEQMYVIGLSTTTATIVRGANGTTAATHANGSALSVYRYPGDVVTATLRLAQRGWRGRETGVIGDFGGGGIPGSGNRDSELSILRSLDSGYRMWSVY